MASRYVLAIDEGSSSTRAVLFDENGVAQAEQSQEIHALFPQPGWVELDPEAVWKTVRTTITGVLAQRGATARDIVAAGITTHRETIIMWDRATGLPIHNAIMWSSKQTDEIIGRWSALGMDQEFRSRTGLRNDSFFSAGKVAWLLENVPGSRSKAQRGELAIGTMDSWLLYKLTGGASHATDFSAASRTALLNVNSKDWDWEFIDMLGLEASVLPNLLDSNSHFGDVSGTVIEGADDNSIPILSVLGDQMAGLFGQACLDKGDAKNTYGTAGVLTVNVGAAPQIMEGMSSSVAWSLDGEMTFEAEGVVFFSGKTIAWLRDNLGILSSSEESAQLAQSIPDNGGVYLVPAFSGLCDPYWDRNVRGTILGLQLDTTRAHIARAGIESMAYQTAVNVQTLKSGGLEIPALKIDGAAVSNDWLCQFQADILGIPVQRPTVVERTALGVAHIAGAAANLWNLNSISERWELEREFEPAMSHDERENLLAGWSDAVTAAQSLPPRRI